ncbi:MAG: Gfo/Idh/MocA family protein [Bacillota bacterium]
MKIGILGAGFGAYHASIYSKLDTVSGIKVFGRNKEKLDKLKDELKIDITDSINDILNDKDIDLVDVCLPTSLHKEHVIEALKRGKHVFCETPVALSIEDGIAMKKAEEQHCRRVFVNQFVKHEYPYSYIYETMQSTTLGELKALHIRRKTPPLWGDLSLDKITTSLMIHELDIITWLFGMPYDISAAGFDCNKGESHVTALLSYKNSLVSVEASSMMPQYHPFTVSYEAVFSKGTIEYYEHGYADRCERSLKLFTDNKCEELPIPDSNCYEDTIKHVINCCKENKPTIIGLDSAISSLELALKIKNMIMHKAE